MINFFAVLAIVFGISFLILCLIIHKKSPNSKWLLASAILALGVIASGSNTIYNTMWKDKTSLNVIQNDNVPQNKNISED